MNDYTTIVDQLKRRLVLFCGKQEGAYFCKKSEDVRSYEPKPMKVLQSALNAYIEEPSRIPVPDEIAEMVAVSTKMVRDALDAFVERDSKKAARVIREDDMVDTLNRVVIEQLHEAMKQSPENIEPAVHCFSASRHLERIADLAENISEDVIYLVEGEIIRHKHGTYLKSPAAD